MKNVFENIRAEEITETEFAAGGAIVRDNGTFDVYDGDYMVGSFADYDTAVREAINTYRTDTAYYASKEDYRNRRQSYVQPVYVYQPVYQPQYIYIY